MRHNLRIIIILQARNIKTYLLCGNILDYPFSVQCKAIYKRSNERILKIDQHLVNL